MTVYPDTLAQIFLSGKGKEERIQDSENGNHHRKPKAAPQGPKEGEDGLQ